MTYYLTNEELYHHGILGQKWGVRRFQNKDGSYTSAGKKRYSLKEINEAKKKYVTEKDKLNKLNRKKWELEANVDFSDDVYDKFVTAREMWDYDNNRMLSDEEIDINWNKYEKARDEVLKGNKQYQKILKDIEKTNIEVERLKQLIETHKGQEYLNDALMIVGSMGAAALVGYLTNKMSEL